jgi:hypothetical protein
MKDDMIEYHLYGLNSKIQIMIDNVILAWQKSYFSDQEFNEINDFVNKWEGFFLQSKTD